MKINQTKPIFFSLFRNIVISIVLLLLHYFHFLASATDTICLKQNTPDGQTIVSPGGVFELGFFGLNNTRFVGIWSKKYPNGKIVWVANRKQPVTDLSGALMIGPDGNLIIVNGKRETVWSTNITLASNNTISVLLETGNLVLMENKSNGLVFWESFEYPSDTLLPGMKIGMNKRAGSRISLNSWKGDRDPSIGNYSAVMDPQESPQIFIMNGSVKRWRTGQWTGKAFIGLPTMIQDYRAGFSLSVDNEGGDMYFNYAPFNDSITQLVYLSSSGNVILSNWDEDSSQWLEEKLAPVGPCDLYGTCGAFGNCDGDKLPICQCVRGYEPIYSDEWSTGNWSGGCVRRTEFECERNVSSDQGRDDGFSAFPGVKLPDLSHYLYADNVSDCIDVCLQNCSCLACAFVDGLGCMLWGDDIIDLRKLPIGGEELHIRLAFSELDTGGKTKSRILAIIIVPIAILLTSVAYVLWRLRNKKGEILPSDDSDPEENAEVPLFSLHTIEGATDKFSLANKLGEGGFGPVYKGKLPNGQEIAVKRLSKSSGQGDHEFKNEVILFSKLQHRNLVKLLGLCIQGDEKILVYEYMPNNSLDSFIFGSSLDKEVLDWSLRYKIIEGIARGLLYLHRDSRLKIIHRDLKASNILLDEHMNPKIADFGMARIFGGDQSVANTKRVVGTYGYMPPEYAMQGIFSEKSDVFSFGVLLLEIVSGKRNNGYHHDENPQNLVAHAWELWNEGKTLELFDSSMVNSCNPTQVNRCIHLALLCVQDQVCDRPTMSRIVSMFGNDMNLEFPKRPAFGERPDVTNLSTCSRNYMTISRVDGR